MSFRPITKDEALAIHSAVVAGFGGIDGVRDEGFLESALAQFVPIFRRHRAVSD